MRFKTIQPNNPILRLEINYQRRTIPRWLQWFDRFGVIVLAVVISLILLFAPLNGDLYGSNAGLGPETLYLLVYCVWLTQLVVIIRCVIAGVNVMRHHKAWWHKDILSLSGITRKQILIGKFWSSLYQLRGWIVAFGIINLAVVALMSTDLAVYCYRSSLEDVRGEAIRGVVLSPYTAYQLQAEYCPNPRQANQYLLIIIHAVATSILGIMASTAIGLVGGLIGNQVVGLTIAFFCRFVPVVIFTIFPDYPMWSGSIIIRWYESAWFSLADGGLTGSLRSGSFWYGPDGRMMTIEPILRAFWAAIGMYIAYLVFAFFVSHILLRRQGFLSASSK